MTNTFTAIQTPARRERCMCHCARCISGACNQCTEAGAWCAGREPDWGKASLAVIASDGKGNGCALHWVGIHFEQWRSDVGSSLKDLGLDDAPCGISVWEGKIESERDYYGETDAWLEGEFREPTLEEWDCINHDDCPWDDNEWYLPTKCTGRYVDFQGATRACLPGGEGCGLSGCAAAHGPQGGW